MKKESKMLSFFLHSTKVGYSAGTFFCTLIPFIRWMYFGAAVVAIRLPCCIADP
jgi:hypothetical protein